MIVYEIDKEGDSYKRSKENNYIDITNKEEKENNNKEEDTIHRG